MTTRWLPLSLFFGLSVLTGCGGKQQEQAVQAGKPSAGTQTAVLNPTLLEPLLLTQPPTQPLSVAEAKKKPAGEKVVVRGRVPPDNVKPFNPGFAAFVMLNPEDFDRPEVKEEFECDDAPTCPKCRKILDDFGVRVELVDAGGKVIASTVEGFRNLKGGSLITIEGVIQRDGKDNKNVRIVAQRFYPG
jgi:hypothetical protein